MSRKFVKIQPVAENGALLGSSSARADLKELEPLLNSIDRKDVIVEFDLRNAEHINGSYLRASFFWCYQCGNFDASSSIDFPALTGDYSPRSYPFFPVFSHCCAEVLEEAIDFLNQRSMPALLINGIDGEVLQSGKILGSLDDILARSLALLCSQGEATARDLQTESEEKITVNGWSNRLSDLFAMRLVTRRREGKFWYYSSLVKEISKWA